MKQVIGGFNTQLVVVKLYLLPQANWNVNVQSPGVLQLIFDWTWNSLSFIENLELKIHFYGWLMCLYWLISLFFPQFSCQTEVCWTTTIEQNNEIVRVGQDLQLQHQIPQNFSATIPQYIPLLHSFDEKKVKKLKPYI